MLVANEKKKRTESFVVAVFFPILLNVKHCFLFAYIYLKIFVQINNFTNTNNKNCTCKRCNGVQNSVDANINGK